MDVQARMMRYLCNCFMNKLLLLCVVVAVCFSSCDKEAPLPLTKEQITSQIDSITRLRVQEVDERAKKDLEHRIKIEVKVKADSIRQAMLQPKTVDPAAKKNIKQ